MKILVVDDLEANRLLLSHLIEEQGHVAISSASALEAFAMYKEQGADMIFMDVVMPGMDVYLAAKQLKEMIADAFVPIIFITALQEEEDLVRCLEFGDDYLVRPFNQSMFNAKVAAHIRTIDLHKKAQKQHEELNALHITLLQEQTMAQHVFEHAAQASNQSCDNVQSYLSSCSLFNGDVLLVAESPAGGLYIMLGDFTGHGLPAALGTLPLSQIFYSLVLKQISVGDLAREINKVLADLLPNHMFCAAVIAELNNQGDNIKLWTGGLHDTFIVDEQSNIVERISSLHMPLGILPDEEFNSRSIEFSLKPTDRIVLYTDGILELPNEAGEFLGGERFEQIVQASNCDIKTLCNALAEYAGSRTGSEVYDDNINHQDDISLVCLSAGPVSFQQTQTTPYELSRPSIPWCINMELGASELKAGSPISQLTDMIGEATGLFSHKPLLTILMSEIFNNALEHGILKLDSKMKKDMNGLMQYYSEREKRLAALEQGFINIRAQHQVLDAGGELIIEVQDSGGGFDFQKALAANSEAAQAENKVVNKERSHGRGLSLISQLCESVAFTEQGSCIKVVYRYIKH